MEQPKIQLSEEKETLFIPLYSKAQQSQRRRPILKDPKAEQILAQIDYDFSRLQIPSKTHTLLAMRAKKLDDCVRQFLSAHPRGPVLELGCGLDSRALRIARPEVPWYDLDYPEVIALRQQFYSPSATYHMLGASVTDPAWLQCVAEDGPAMVIAEGMLMYLHPEQVKELFLRLQGRFPGSEIAFDAFSSLTVRKFSEHPSMQQTQAQVRWGIDDAEEIEAWGPSIHLLEDWAYSSSSDIDKLGLGEQIMIRLVGAFSMARNAHRILRYQL